MRPQLAYQSTKPRQSLISFTERSGQTQATQPPASANGTTIPAGCEPRPRPASPADDRVYDSDAVRPALRCCGATLRETSSMSSKDEATSLVTHLASLVTAPRRICRSTQTVSATA